MRDREASEILYSPYICACIHEYVRSNDSVQNSEILSQLSAQGNAKINRGTGITKRPVHFDVECPDYRLL